MVSKIQNSRSKFLYLGADCSDEEVEKYADAFGIRPVSPAKKCAANPPAAKGDMVNSPAHYTFGGIEAIDYIASKLSPEEYRGYLRGTVLKYLSRVGLKNDAAEDICKAKWFLDKLVASFSE